MLGTVQQSSSIFFLLFHFIGFCFAQYNMAEVNLIDDNDLRVLNYGAVVNNKAVEKSIFVVFEGKTRKQCLWTCSSTAGCVAYNYGSNGGICQLSNDTSPCALVSKPGFIHQGVFNFRECYKVFGVKVSVISAKTGQFIVGEQIFPLSVPTVSLFAPWTRTVIELTKHTVLDFMGLVQDHGHNFLAVHMNGSIHGQVTSYDLAHGGSMDEVNAYINTLPDGLIVLMAVVADNHLAPSKGVGNIPLLGSSYADPDLVGMQRWALIGYKGPRQPWISEGLTKTLPVKRRVTTYTFY